MKTKTISKAERPPTLLTVKQVAEFDQCSEKTVRRAITAGLLRVQRIGPGGRLIRIDPRDHAAYRAHMSA
jgi:excisionase family DNA binding protein